MKALPVTGRALDVIETPELKFLFEIVSHILMCGHSGFPLKYLQHEISRPLCL
jgi:hypothetical protein